MVTQIDCSEEDYRKCLATLMSYNDRKEEGKGENVQNENVYVEKNCPNVSKGCSVQRRGATNFSSKKKSPKVITQTWNSTYRHFFFFFFFIPPLCYTLLMQMEIRQIGTGFYIVPLPSLSLSIFLSSFFPSFFTASFTA
ncbi:hypothetical protein POVWA1_035710 [Plasmodium ovale wallikeri]|uniref:Uncharacterized protein n=1 Tax=Plasmodium ovale wallikeri TaxID=864142 RepID=A0A1A8Z0V0_PLAOA|nr:hypothetical protein POVWA1_035710 [Plasmodium ovale wallikeri]